MRLAVSEMIDEGLVRSCVYTEQTGSTNSDALQSLQTDAAAPSHLPRLYLTDRQTSGRGRQGNQWHSSNDSLTFSLLCDFDLQSPNAALVSIATGIGVAQGIEHCCSPLRVMLKWPNDICAIETDRKGQIRQLRKLGGILIETSASAANRLVIGIGINVDRAPEQLADSQSPALALADIAQRSVGREELLNAITASVLESISDLQIPERLMGQYRSRCVLTGRAISLRQNDQLVEGVCRGISDEGSLLLECNGQTLELRSGQVQRVRFSG
ncbi:biotin--[acetyl-CoA-carboxylase] ligase [Rhodopirellula sp. MGV]|nr:biotin--[acetyl-CoA-carboxylase] ligase [Rhodopirellula sp. MGV]PNY37076.1 biotin--[acetyl-CoA-carboxylase] ligase [Rhodopirellula baltica]